MKNIYQSELEWMQDFYKELELEPDYSLNTDWKINWNLLEFKLNFTNLNAHKNQIKRYIQAYNSGAYQIIWLWITKVIALNSILSQLTQKLCSDTVFRNIN